jgi:hypothetical protein
MPRIYVDFNTLNSEPIDLVKLGQTGVDDLPPLHPGERVLLYDEEMEVTATIQYDREHAFWLAAPDWGTRVNLDAVP